MKEEKMLKHWLKRRFKITVALVVGFLITGGTSFAGSIEDLEKRVAELEKKQVHYFSVNSDDSAAPDNTNYNNDGAKGENSIAIGHNATVESGGHDPAGAIAIGNKAKVFNTNRHLSIAIGDGAEASYGSIVIGKGTKDYDPNDSTKATFGVLIGHEVKTFGGTAETALGSYAEVKGEESTAIGSSSKALGNESVAVGGSAKALGDTSTAIGIDSIADKKTATASGAYANARGYRSTASGAFSVAAGNNSIAIGYQAFAHNGFISEDEYNALSDSEKEKYFQASGIRAYFLKDTSTEDEDGFINTSIGTFSKAMKRGTSLGGYSQARGEESLSAGYRSTATKKRATALGSWSKAAEENATSVGFWAQTTGKNSTALGAAAVAKSSAGIALGSSSIADRDGGILGYNPVSGKQFVDEKEVAEFLGKKSELEAINQEISEKQAAYDADQNNKDNAKALELAKNKKSELLASYHSVAGAVSVGDKDYTRQITNVAAGSEDTDAVNVAQLKAVANQVTTVTTNLNNKANTNLDNITNEGKKVITDLVDVTGSNGIQVTTTTDGTTQKKTFNIALNKNLTDKINKEESVSEAAQGMISVDSSKKNSTGGKDFVVDLKQEVKNKINSIGTGKIEKGDKNTVTGETVYNYVKTATTNANIAYKGGDEESSKTVKSSEGFHFKGDANIKVSTGDNGVINHTLNSDLTGITSISNKKTKITLGEDNTIDMGGAKITKIAKGEVSATSTDAINGSQLQETNTKVEKLEKDSMKQIDAIHKTVEDVKNVKKEVGHVGALGAALAGLHPMQYDPLQPNQVMAGIGAYRDKQAVAVGVTHYFNENLMMTAGISVGEENRVKTMANVGLTWKIGKDDDRKDLPERYKEGPIGSIYMMQEEVEGLLQENKVQKTKLREQEDKIAEQQQQINKIEKQLELLLKQK